MLPYNLKDMRRSPGMFLPSTSYDNATAYVLGINAATDSSFLVGFQEWVVLAGVDAEIECQPSWHWSGNLLLLAYPTTTLTEDHQQLLDDSNGHEKMIRFFLDQLEKFLEERRQDRGLKKVYCRYQAWLERQEWFNPERDG